MSATDVSIFTLFIGAMCVMLGEKWTQTIGGVLILAALAVFAWRG